MEKKSRCAFNLLDSKLRKYFKKHADTWDPKGNWRWPSVCYTMEHKLAYLEREHYLCGHYTWRGLFHDWKKPFMYLLSKKTEKEIQEHHRKNSSHHVESRSYNKIGHLVEMYIDWECAALTKPDKPLNAFETLIHFYPEYIDLMLPLCLAFDVKSVRQDVYLHSSHKLTTDKAYNLAVYEKILSTLERMNNVFYYPQMLKNIKKEYRLGRSVADMTPEDLFLLVVSWLNNGKINYACINGVIEQVYKNMQQHTMFTHTTDNKMSHSHNMVKLSTYRR